MCRLIWVFTVHIYTIPFLMADLTSSMLVIVLNANSNALIVLNSFVVAADCPFVV